MSVGRTLTVTCDTCGKVIDVTATPEEPVVMIGFGASPPITCGLCAQKRSKRELYKRKVRSQVDDVLQERLDKLADDYATWAARRSVTK